MNSNNQKIIVNIEDSKYLNWKLYLKSKLKSMTSKYIEIDSKNLNLSCTDISEITEIANQYNCRIIGFYSKSSKTIVSSQSLGYKSQFIESSSINTSEINKKVQLFQKLTFIKELSGQENILKVLGIC